MIATDEPKLELVEKSIHVEAERVVTGRVRVTTRSDLYEEIAHASLAGERVEVTRETIGHEVSEAPPTRVEGDVTIIPVLEKVVVVEKSASGTSPRRRWPSRSRSASKLPRLKDRETRPASLGRLCAVAGSRRLLTASPAGRGPHICGNFLAFVLKRLHPAKELLVRHRREIVCKNRRIKIFLSVIPPASHAVRMLFPITAYASSSSIQTGA